MQLDALKSACCSRIFSENALGARAGRPELSAALDYMWAGDTLVVSKLDRLETGLPRRAPPRFRLCFRLEATLEMGFVGNACLDEGQRFSRTGGWKGDPGAAGIKPLLPSDGVTEFPCF